MVDAWIRQLIQPLLTQKSSMKTESLLTPVDSEIGSDNGVAFGFTLFFIGCLLAIVTAHTPS
jgi:hypothetical protein